MKAGVVFLVVFSVCTLMWKHAAEVRGDEECGVMAAVAAGDADGVLRLLAAGAPLVDESGTPIVVWASWQGQTRVLEALLRHGVDPNAQTPAGWTALMMAVMADRTEAVEVLLSAGAELEARTEVGATALSMAIDRGNDGIVEMLLRAGAGRGEVVAAGR